MAKVFRYHSLPARPGEVVVTINLTRIFPFGILSFLSI